MKYFVVAVGDIDEYESPRAYEYVCMLKIVNNKTLNNINKFIVSTKIKLKKGAQKEKEEGGEDDNDGDEQFVLP